MDTTRTILVCNESQDERRSICSALVKGGYRKIDESASGDNAIDKLSKKQYDIAPGQITDRRKECKSRCMTVFAALNTAKTKSAPIPM